MTQTLPDYVKTADSPQTTVPGMNELTPYSKPGRYLTGTIVFALFWNTIFLILYKSMHGKDSIILLMAIFIAVDVYLLITFYFFIGAYRQPALKISSKCPRICEPVILTWELPDYRSITRLVISLEGFEHIDVPLYDAQYTCRNAITSIILTDTTKIQDIKTGSAEFKIPDNLTSSLIDGKCRIVWKIKLLIKRKLNSSQLEYIINVQPQ